MAKILGLGNALVDVLITIENDDVLKKLNLPRGSMQLVDEHFLKKATDLTSGLKQTVAAGGSAANTINGIANLGLQCAFIGQIGHDKYGGLYMDDLEKNNIQAKLLISNTQTGRATVFISKDSERTFGTYLGAAVEMSAEDLKPEMFRGFNIIHLEGYLVQNHELIERAMIIAKQEGLTISLDLASYNVVESNNEFLHKVVKKYVDILFANEEEAKAFTGKLPEEALDEIAKDVDIAVVKIGSKGSLIKRGGLIEKIGVIKVKSIDTTGAGDLYAAGFLYGFAKGLPLAKCGKMGSILSGKVIEVIGPKMSESTWREINEMVEAAENE